MLTKMLICRVENVNVGIQLGMRPGRFIDMWSHTMKLLGKMRRLKEINRRDYINDFNNQPITKINGLASRGAIRIGNL